MNIFEEFFRQQYNKEVDQHVAVANAFALVVQIAACLHHMAGEKALAYELQINSMALEFEAFKLLTEKER